MDKEYKSKGKFTCNKNIIYSIVALATKEISGVVGISRKKMYFLQKLLPFKKEDGIKIKYDVHGFLIVDVFIDVYSNISAPDLCFKVQETIKNNIYSMVEVKAAHVNVHIVDVIIRDEEVINEETV